jgi:hypothetical protein
MFCKLISIGENEMRKFWTYIFTLFFFASYAQDGYYMLKGKKKQVMRFKLIHNLMIIPLEVNGNMGSYILDTGISKNILFTTFDKDLELNDSLKRIKINGFGTGEPIEAYILHNNTFKYKNIVAYNQNVVLLHNRDINFSAKTGMTINGLIGGDFFKEFIVKINYSRKKITLYNPKFFKQKKKSSMKTFPLTFHRGKPYINAYTKVHKGEEGEIPVKLLIDSGGSDALWFFEDDKKFTRLPENNFMDYLGEGITGNIYGYKSLIEEFRIGEFQFERPIVSFLDKETTELARKITGRNGTLGGGLLKRFNVWFNYKERKITLKKNSNFKKSFKYNLSGIEVNYSGDVLVMESGHTKHAMTKEENKMILSSPINFKFVLKPSYYVANVRPNSVANIAGIKKGDVLLKINNHYTYNMSFEHIYDIFYSKRNKKINLIVERNGEELKFEFRLVPIF